MTEHDHRRGADACPLCSRHDHTNTEPFGFDRDTQPVPAWWFTCPRCGTHETQEHVRRWTPQGLAWIRDHADHVGTFNREAS